MKIYSKKRFISGLLFLTLFILSIITLMINIKRGKDVIYIGKEVITSLIALLLGVSLIRTSINEKANKEAEQNENDERTKLVEIKAGNSVNKIMNYIYWIIIYLSIFAWIITRVDELLIPVIIVGPLVTVNIVLNIVATIYYEKKYSLIK